MKPAAGLAVVLAIALVVAVRYFGANSDRPASKPQATATAEPAAFTPAARRVARQFLAAVGREDRALARSLLAPDAPCFRLIVPAGPFRPSQVKLAVGHADLDHLYLDVRIRPNGSAFMMGLERRGADRWRVDYWDSRYGPVTATCPFAQTSS